MLDLGLGTHHDAAATRHQRLPDTLVAVYDSTRREVGALDILYEILALDLGVVDIGAAGIDHLAQIVRRHVGRHTYGDTARTVDKKQRNLCRQHGRLLYSIVEVERPVDRLLLDVCHYLVGDLLHACLGITHGRRRVAVHRTEVTLTLDQRIAHRPVLGHTHHSFVYRAVAVGVELTEHVTDYTGALTRGFVRVEIQLGAHIVKYATMHGLQSVSDIGQRTRHYDRHRIVDIGGLHLLFEIDRNDTSDQTGILLLFCQHLVSVLIHFLYII